MTSDHKPIACAIKIPSTTANWIRLLKSNSLIFIAKNTDREKHKARKGDSQKRQTHMVLKAKAA